MYQSVLRSSALRLDMNDVNEEEAEEEAARNLRAAVRMFTNGMKSNSITCITEFTDKGYDINTIVDLGGQSALHFATGLGRFDIVEALIENKIDIMSKTTNGNSALMISIIQSGNVIDDDNHIRIFNFLSVKLLEIGFNLHSNSHVKNTGETLLMLACRSGSMNMISILLKCPHLKGHNRFDPYRRDHRRWNSLHYFADRFNRNVSAIHRMKPSNVVDMLIKHATVQGLVNVPNQEGNTPLHVACMVSDPIEAIVNSLIHHDARVSSKNHMMQTPLHIVSHSGKNAIVNRLCLAGADIQAMDEDGRTPLHVSISKQGVRVFRKKISDAVVHTIEILIRFRGPLQVSTYCNMRDNFGMTALLIACRESTEPVVRFLLNVPRIDMHAKDGTGNTALHQALNSNDHSIIRLLLDYISGTLYARNSDGKTPLMIASENNRDPRLLRIFTEANERTQQRYLALATGQHERLGNMSRIGNLTDELMRMIRALG